MSKTLSSLTIELRQNPRLRAGLWLIAAILIGYVVILLNDYQVKLQLEHKNALNQLNQLQTIINQTQWLERATQANALRNQLEVKFWQANTKGLAQATFQEWLNTEMKRVQMIEGAYLRIMDSALEMPNYPEVWKVTARIDAPFTQQSLSRLLLAIAEQPLLIVTERLEIRHSNTPRFTLIVSAYFKAPG